MPPQPAGPQNPHRRRRRGKTPLQELGRRQELDRLHLLETVRLLRRGGVLDAEVDADAERGQELGPQAVAARAVLFRGPGLACFGCRGEEGGVGGARGVGAVEGLGGGGGRGDDVAELDGAEGVVVLGWAEEVGLFWLDMGGGGCGVRGC